MNDEVLGVIGDCGSVAFTAGPGLTLEEMLCVRWKPGGFSHMNWRDAPQSMSFHWPSSRISTQFSVRAELLGSPECQLEKANVVPSAHWNVELPGSLLRRPMNIWQVAPPLAHPLDARASRWYSKNYRLINSFNSSYKDRNTISTSLQKRFFESLVGRIR